MQLIADVRTCTQDFQNLHLTIGNFDGLHLGHQTILRQLIEKAHANKGTAALMTLRPHPAWVFSPETAPKRICTNEQMATLLEGMGLDVLFVLPFTLETSKMDRDTFLKEIVLNRCRAKHLVLGHDFAFGHQAAGNINYLNELASPLEFTVEEIAPVLAEGNRISSSNIRRLIQDGELEQVAAQLGRPFSIRGDVNRGRGIGGKTLGFPTANIDPSEYVLPPLGIYAAEAEIMELGIPERSRHMAAVNLGIAPTFAHDKVMLEAFLLDFEGDLTGKTLEIHFGKYIRPEMKYNTKEALIEAIAQDVEAVRAYFS